jgi:hypothetical protein
VIHPGGLYSVSGATVVSATVPDEWIERMRLFDQAMDRQNDHGEAIMIILKTGEEEVYHGKKVIHTDILLHQE